MNLKSFTYDIHPDDRMPEKGEYIVSIGKKGVGQVMLIQTCRKVNQKVLRPYSRYAITAVLMPELKLYTEYEALDGDYNVWVRGELAWWFTWYPRGKKSEKQ